MSEHRPFTDEDARRYYDTCVAKIVAKEDIAAHIAANLNRAFPQGLAAPKPAMRTKPVTAEECKGIALYAGWLPVNKIERLLGVELTGCQFARLLMEVDGDCREAEHVARAINTVFGLREPELPLVTIEEAKQIFTNLSGGSSFEYERKRLEDFVRSKMPKPEADV